MNMTQRFFEKECDSKNRSFFSITLELTLFFFKKKKTLQSTDFFKNMTHRIATFFFFEIMTQRIDIFLE